MEVSSISNIKDDSSTVDIEASPSSDVDGGAATTKMKIKPKAQQRLEKRRRIGLFVFSALTATLYAGAWFSWGPMQLLLEARGVFGQLCEEGEPTPCPAQTTRLLTVPFVAQFAIVLSPIMGVIADKYGPLMLMNVASACGLIGLGLMTLATGLRIDNLIFVAYFLVGVMAMSAAVNTVQVGMLFDPITRQRVISALNTLFDAGLLTYLALWGIQEVTGCSIEALLGCYTAIGALCFGGSINYWRLAVPVDGINSEYAPTEEEDAVDDVETEDCNDEEEGRSWPTDGEAPASDNLSQDQSESPKCTILADEDRDEAAVLELGELAANKPESNDDSAAALKPVDGTVMNPEVVSDSITDSISNSNDDYVLIADRPPMQQLRSKQFLTLTIFFAIQATRDMFNLTTARDFLAYLGDDETGNKYLTIYTLLTPASILGLPVLDFVLTRYGYHAGLQTINVLALAQGIIMISSDNLNVQVLGFIFASFFRCFMYTICLGILPAFLGVNAVGKGSGIMPCAAGVLSLVNIPLSSWAVNKLDGNFFYPNLIYTILIVPCIYLAWVLGQGMKREERTKERLSKSN